MCIRSALRELIVAVFVATSGLVPATSVPEHSGHLPRVPVPPPVATSAHPIVLGASPGTTGTMSLFYALKRLNVTTVHYTRLYNASDGSDETTYGAPSSGAPLPLLAPLFAAEGRPPPVKFGINLEQSIDLTFLRGARVGGGAKPNRVVCPPHTRTSRGGRHWCRKRSVVASTRGSPREAMRPCISSSERCGVGSCGRSAMQDRNSKAAVFDALTWLLLHSLSVDSLALPTGSAARRRRYSTRRPWSSSSRCWQLSRTRA